ncbi:MAG: type I secretion system permease/ATPase [Rhodocyclaceae bacterium]|nr:type I secretion system permease/ATPase [Rhodocyclaceae bacterium]
MSRVLLAFRREFWTVGIFSLTINVLMLTPTLYMLQIYDRVLVSQSGLTLVALSLVALFLFLVMAFAEWTRSRILVRAGVSFDEALNVRVFSASFDAALNQNGMNPRQAFLDLTNLRQFLTGNGIFAFFDAPWTPVYLGVLFLLHPYLGWLAIIFAASLAALTWLAHRATQATTAELVATAKDASLYLQSKVRNAEVIEAMGMSGNLRRHWRNRQNRHLFVAAKSQELGRRWQSLIKGMRYSQQSLMLGAGAWLVIEGDLTIGGMIAANVLMSRALAPIDLVAATWKSFITAAEAYRSLTALLSENPPRAAGESHPKPTGAMRVVGLVASAHGREKPILNGIDLEFSPGTMTAILGPSGSGKSTLARCLVGVWPQWQGRVLLDGVPIERWGRGDLGPHIGYLPQDVELLEGTIAENIARFGEIKADEVILAAKRAGIHEMILRFPMGYDTPIGEGGAFLSGGQRQRVGLARAIYGEPALIVLDEPNANLDEVGEAALQETLATLRQLGKTVVLITHRPAALGLADRIVLLSDGCVKLQGPREEVLARLSASRPNLPPTTVAPQTA